VRARGSGRAGWALWLSLHALPEAVDRSLAEPFQPIILMLNTKS
jgi:hypothetical protein